MLAACRAAGAAAWYVPDDYLVLGPELVPSGSFDSSAGWNLGSGFSVSSGKLIVSGAAQSANAVINLGLATGKNYLIAYDIDSISGGAITPIASNGAAASQQTTTGAKTGFITPLGASGNIGFSSSSAAALTAVIDNFSVREILSAKDFQDSANTLPSYLGGTVGFTLDNTVQIGIETLVDTKFNDPSKWFLNQPTSGSVTVSSGAVTVISLDGSFASAYALASNQVAQIVVGKAYFAEFEVSAASGGGVRVDCGGFVGQARTAPGVYRQYFIATSNGAPFVSRGSAVACSGTVTRLSVREVSGNHVTQATAGNRPIVSRIPRKFGPELVTNGGFDTADGWSVTGSPVISSGGASLATGSDWVEQGVATRAGATYWVSVNSTAAIYCGAWDSPNRSNNLSASAGVRQSGRSGFSFVANDSMSFAAFTATGSGATVIDNVSVREVLEWSYALTFDGTNDSLATAASVIGATLTQTYTMITWGKTAKSDGTVQRIIGDTARWLAIGAAGNISVTNQAASTITTTAIVAAGEPFIAESTWDGATMRIWKNGVLDKEAPCSAPSGITPSPTNIGINGNAANYFKGDFGGAVVCPAVMTEAQRLAVRKFAAAQMGMTL